MKRQQRKLNFLITQTELYAHFMARKLTGATDAERDAILQHFDEPVPMKPQPVIGGMVCTMPNDDYGLLLILLYLLYILVLERRCKGNSSCFLRIPVVNGERMKSADSLPKLLFVCFIVLTLFGE